MPYCCSNFLSVSPQRTFTVSLIYFILPFFSPLLFPEWYISLHTTLAQLPPFHSITSFTFALPFLPSSIPPCRCAWGLSSSLYTPPIPLGAPHTQIYFLFFLSERKVTFLRQDIKQTGPLYHKAYVQPKLFLWICENVLPPPPSLQHLPPPLPPCQLISSPFLTSSHSVTPTPTLFPISPLLLLSIQCRLNLSQSLNVSQILESVQNKQRVTCEPLFSSLLGSLFVISSGPFQPVESWFRGPVGFHQVPLWSLQIKALN